MMKRSMLLLPLALFAMMLCVPLVSDSVLAAKKSKGPDTKGKKEKVKKETSAKPTVVKVTATVKVVKDDRGKITSVTLTADDGEAYSLTLDIKAKMLAKKMDGKKVEATGLYYEKDGEKRLKIGKYKEAKPDEAEEEQDK